MYFVRLLIQIPMFIIVLQGHMYAMKAENGFIPFKEYGTSKGLLITPTQTSQKNLNQLFQYMYSDENFENLFVRDIISSKKDVIKLQLPEEFKIPKKIDGLIFEATVSADNTYLALGGILCSQVYMFDNKGNYLKEKSPKCSFDGIIAFSSNNEYLAAVCTIGGGFARIWRMDALIHNKKPSLQVKVKSPFNITAATFNCAGNYFAVGSNNEELKIFGFEKNSYKDYTTFNILKRVGSACFSPTDENCLAAGYEKEIWLWSLLDTVPLKKLQGHTKTVIKLCFSPDGTLLVSSSKDKTVRIWDVQTGECLQTIENVEPALNIIFDGSGKYFAISNCGPNGVRSLDQLLITVYTSEEKPQELFN